MRGARIHAQTGDDGGGAGRVALARHRLAFLRRCRDVVSRLAERYDTLWNYIDARNKVAIRWLAWCDSRSCGAWKPTASKAGHSTSSEESGGIRHVPSWMQQ